MAAKVPNDFSDEIDSGVPPRSGGAVDDALQLKKRARRRLVGAIALALFAIILLPLVMDREPPPSAPEIQVRIPSSESTGVVGKLANKPLPASSPSTPSAANTVGVSDTPNVTAVAPVVAPVVAAATNAEAPEKPPEAKVAHTKPTGTSAPSAADNKAMLAGKPEASLPKVESAKDVVTKEASKDAAATATGKWEVQLGAYQSAGNVNLLLAKVKELRLPVYTEKFDTPQGPRTRVRSGPFQNKEAALAAQKRIRIIGVEGQVAPYSK